VPELPKHLDDFQMECKLFIGLRAGLLVGGCVAGHDGREKPSCIDGINTTIYHYKGSHNHMIRSHDWLSQLTPTATPTETGLEQPTPTGCAGAGNLAGIRAGGIAGIKARAGLVGSGTSI
jgi:hypothetical protein